MLNKVVSIVVVAASAQLAGCGAGNAVGSALGLAEILESDGSVQNAAVTQDIPSNEGGGSQPSPNEVPAELRSLYGDGEFRHNFDSNTDRIFALTTQYSSSSIRVSDSGSFSVLTAGNLYISDGGQPFEYIADMNLYCTFISSAVKFLCVAPFVAETAGAQGASVNFLFDRLQNNTVSGSFEFCPEGESSTDCINGLINEPDGPVRVSITPSTSPASPESTMLSASDLASSFELKAMMDYLEQGTVGFNANNGIEFKSNLSQETLNEARMELLTN